MISIDDKQEVLRGLFEEPVFFLRWVRAIVNLAPCSKANLTSCPQQTPVKNFTPTTFMLAAVGDYSWPPWRSHTCLF